MGNATMINSTAGDDNTAIGFLTLAENAASNNTAVGAFALQANTTGTRNTAVGRAAMDTNTTGFDNTAVGFDALGTNTTGTFNTAVGSSSLVANTTGSGNTAAGQNSLGSNTTGVQNTALGHGALGSNTTGLRNIGIGQGAGAAITVGNDNISIANSGGSGSGEIRIGTPGLQNSTFIAGIRGVTTGLADAVTVLIDSAGQLGTVNSTRRVKEDIGDMGKASERLLSLHPVVFRYRQAMADGSKPLQYGLIAEEVAEVMPELVVYDADGQPQTVQYHVLPALLLNELQRQEARAQRQEVELTTLRELLADQAAELAALKSELKAKAERASR
jgi:hypothetical protein